MQFINEPFSYYLMDNSNREAIIGLKKYFPQYVVESDKSKFINSEIIGNIMFELIQDRNIEYPKSTYEKIKYIKFYIDKCIEDVHYCNNKIFLACIKECCSMTLPHKDILIRNYYTEEQIKNYDIIHSNKEKKTDIISKNAMNIEYAKIYNCDKIEDLIVASLYEVFEKGNVIRKCKNCNRFFVTKEKGKRIKYCYNESPQNPLKTCYEHYHQSRANEKRKGDPVISLYNNLSNKIRNRFERAKDNDIKESYYKDLDVLSIQYRDMRKKLKAGKVTKKDILDFLTKFNEEWEKRYVSKRNNKKQKI